MTTRNQVLLHQPTTDASVTSEELKAPWLLYNRELLCPAQEKCWTKSQGLPEKRAEGLSAGNKQHMYHTITTQTVVVLLSQKYQLYNKQVQGAEAA